MSDRVNTDNKYWLRYRKGIEYIDSKNLVARNNKNWNFYIGNQWAGIESGGEELPSFNFLHPNVMRKVTTVYTNRMSVTYTDMEGRSEVDGVDLMPIYTKLSDMFSAKWEKANQDVIMRETLKYACVAQDGIQYYGTGNVEDVQLLNATDVLYGDESERNIQRQPYVIIHERRSVADVKALARENGVPEEEIALIVPDDETEYTIGNADEVEETDTNTSKKVTLITHFEKKKEPVTKNIETPSGEMVSVETGEFEEVVYVAKCTKHLVIEEEHPVRVKESIIDKNMGKKGRALRLYPIVKLSWENYPNDARGVSQVEYLIPNQIEVNKILARRSMVTKLTAFPRPVYDRNALTTPELLDTVGTPIALEGGGVQDIRQLLTYLEPASTSPEPKNLMGDILEITQELSGSGDTTMGNIDLQRVAASAVVAVNEKAESMHAEVVANLEMATEDLANLWVELWQVYSPNGLTVTTTEQVPSTTIDPMTGMPTTTYEEVEKTIEISKEELDLIKPTTRIDVSKDNSFTREAMQTWLDGALEKQYVTLEEYVELCPATSPVPVGKLKKIFEQRKQQQEQMQSQQQMQDPTQMALQQWQQQDGVAPQ